MQLEQYLRQNDQTITVLTDQHSSHCKKTERRLKSRDNLSLKENTVARIKRLKPRILFVNTQWLTKDSFDLLYALNQNCPETLPVVLTKQEADDDQILYALKNGARGIVDCSVEPICISKIIYTVDKGEPWVSRKILAKIMEKMKFA